MNSFQEKTIWSLSIATIVISGIELIFAVSIAIVLSVNSGAILASNPMRNVAVGISQTLERASIEVGTVDIEAQSEDGTTVSYSNIQNIDTSKLKEAGILDSNGKFIGDAASRIATAILSICITAATVAAILAFFTVIIGFIALVNSGKPRKYGTVFGWSLGGAVLCLLVARLVLTVLFAIIAVSAYKGNPAHQKAD